MRYVEKDKTCSFFFYFLTRPTFPRWHVKNTRFSVTHDDDDDNELRDRCPDHGTGCRGRYTTFG